MKVLFINGSPHPQGCTYTALQQVQSQLVQAGIETQWVQVGPGPVRGCIACGGCAKTHRCVFGEDGVNQAIEALEQADGLVVGSPVHYASAGGSVTAFLDRMFYAGSAAFAHKPAACVVSARRAGTTAALDQLAKYFTIAQMPVVSSQYWNMVHGNTPDQVLQDEEGMQIMRTLGRNMAWLLGCIQAGRAVGLLPPAAEPERKRTNFIR